MKQQTAAPSSQVTISRKLPWVFFIAYFSNQVGSALTLMFLTPYLTEYMGLTPEVMVGALTIARVGDLIIALIAGVLVQKTNMRFGQFRSWLLIVMPVVQVATFVTFINPNISMMGKGVLVCVAYFFTSAPMNIFVVVHNSLMAKVSGPSMANRLAITSKLSQGIQFGSIVASLVTLRLVAFFDPNMTRGFPIVAVIFGVIALSGQALMFLSTKQYDPYDPNLKKKAGSTQSVRLGAMFAQTLKNGQLWILLIADMLRQTAIFVLAGMLSYFFIFQVGDMVKTSDGLLVQSICACAGAFFVGPPIAKRLGKKHSVILSGIIAAAAYVCLALFAGDNWVIYIACTSAAVLGISILGAVGIQLYLDAGEYQLYQTGKDNRPYVMSLQTVPMKVGMMLSAPIIAQILKFSGYMQHSDGVNTMANPDLMVRLIGLIPAALYAVFAILMCLFKITEDKSKEYAAANFERMQAKQSSDTN